MHRLFAARRLAAALALGLAFAAAAPAKAYDLALIVAHENYQNLPDLAQGDHVGTLRLRLDRAGFEIVEAVNASRGEMESALADFVARAPEAERLLVVLNGRFLRSDRDWFLLSVGARETDTLDALPRRSLLVSTVMSVLSQHPRRRAVLVMGADGREGRVSRYLERGLGDLPDDPGFVLVMGEVRATNDLAREVLAVPGTAIDARRIRERGLAVAGLDDRALRFIPEGRRLRLPTAAALPPGERPEGGGRAPATVAAPPAPAPSAPVAAPAAQGPAQDEQGFWEMAQALDSERAYVSYLDRFPQGAFARQASERLDDLRRAPRASPAQEGEDDLNLGREDRRRVQTALSVLGHDPRGIDGIFGPGTRTAIQGWQRAQGFEPSGYLSASQLRRLADQGAGRAIELDAQAQAQRADAQRRERALWSETGEGGSAEGLRAYLERYPDGIFAERARERLTALEREVRRSAALADAEAWDAARAEDAPAAYRRYIDANPEGAFVVAARARIDELRAQAAVDERADAARATEDALGLTPIARGLIEGRLEAFGLQPGAVDGRFDDETRRAIRRYQGNRNLEPTGYLDRAAVVQLLADSILR